MRSFPFKGPIIVILSALFIIVSGFVILIPFVAPGQETEEITEIKMDEGGFGVEQFPDVEFGSEISIKVDFLNDTARDNGISLYFMDEENHDSFMERVVKEENISVSEKLEELEFLYSKNCSEDCEFDFTIEEDGDVYMIVLNDGEVRDFSLTLRISSSIEFGVCFAVFLILAIIGVLMIRASRQIGNRHGGR